MYYIEIASTNAICGGIYPLGVYTDKQAIKEVIRRAKEMWREDNERHYKLSFTIATDENALDMVFCIDFFNGDITVYDYRTSEFIVDTMQDRINRNLKRFTERMAALEAEINKGI